MSPHNPTIGIRKIYPSHANLHERSNLRLSSYLLDDTLFEMEKWISEIRARCRSFPNTYLSWFPNPATCSQLEIGWRSSLQSAWLLWCCESSSVILAIVIPPQEGYFLTQRAEWGESSTPQLMHPRFTQETVKEGR